MVLVQRNDGERAEVSANDSAGRRVAELPSPLAQFDRIAAYSTLAARQMYDSGRRAGPLTLLVHPPAAFLRNYVLRRGFLDGSAGLTISLMNAYGVFVKLAKLWELGRAAGGVPPQVY